MVRVIKKDKKTGEVIYDVTLTLKPRKPDRLRTIGRGKYVRGTSSKKKA